MKKSILLMASTLSATLFYGCSDSNINESGSRDKDENMDIVANVDDLPKCGNANNGEQIFVKAESLVRVCVDGEWYATKSENRTDSLYVNNSCVSMPLDDDSGVKILCGGDSVGVVLNGTDGKDGTNGSDGRDGQDCAVETLADNSGLKVICGGDSVGVVLSGTDGEHGKDGVDGADASCEMSQNGSILEFTCGDKVSFVDLKDIAFWDRNGNLVLDSEMIMTDIDGIGGFSQKGPFLVGADVMINEISNGRSLNQTGKFYQGKIMNDNGEFYIGTEKLASQYVYMNVRGSYRNEVTGDVSDGEISLMALTDLRNRTSANINLMTHMETFRATYLVTEIGKKVPEAKEQIRDEIFGAFYIDSKDFAGSSEDLNIGGSGKADGALLAISIMLQGDRRASGLSELVTRIGDDMKLDGTWDNAQARAEVADWSLKADSANRFEAIRNNVAQWGISLKVADFEPYIRNYWYQELGLGDCGGTKGAADGTVAYVTNPNSAYYAESMSDVRNTKTRFTCRAIDGRWLVSGAFEKDTYGWAAGNDGELRPGFVTGESYIYDEYGAGTIDHRPGWRLAESIEKLYGGCSAEKFDVYRRFADDKNGRYYQCDSKNHKWVVVNIYLAIDTHLWQPKEDGYASWGDSIGVTTNDERICYVYDSEIEGYRVGSKADCSLGIEGCTKRKSGIIQYSKVDGNFYNCVDNRWVIVNDRVRINTEGWVCNSSEDGNEGEMRLGRVHDAYFVCENYAWREASPEEETVCRNGEKICQACTERGVGSFAPKDTRKFICYNKKWIESNWAEKFTNSYCLENDSSIVTDISGGGLGIDWICSGNRWHKVVHPYEYKLNDWNARKAKYYTNAYLPNAIYKEDLIDSRDNNVYKVVQIGSQVWMAENLRYVDSLSNINLKGQTWCANDETKNCEIGGRYYTWTAAMNIDVKWQSASAAGFADVNNHQGICPDGWRIPSRADYEQLISFTKSSKNGSVLLAAGLADEQNATDGYGFSALLVASVHSSMYNDSYGNISMLQMSDDNVRDISRDSEYLRVQKISVGFYSDYHSGWGPKVFGIPVRCIKAD